MLGCAGWWFSAVKIHQRRLCVLRGDVSFWFVPVQGQNTQKRAKTLLMDIHVRV